MAEATRSLRLQVLRQILRSEVVARQETLVQRLLDEGFQVTQSSVSRDLQELGVDKIGGRYTLPEAREVVPGIRSGESAGPHLLVLKTDIGAANLIAVKIDQIGLSEVVGTIAGDDTIFLATKSAADQAAAARALGVELDG